MYLTILLPQRSRTNLISLDTLWNLKRLSVGILYENVNPLSTNPTKWSNTLK